MWPEKPFIRDSIPAFFHLPLPFMIVKMIGQMWGMAKNAVCAPEMSEFLLLAKDPSLWKSEHCLSVTGEIPGADIVTLSGEFLSKVYDGPYNVVPKWIKDITHYTAESGKEMKDLYFFYTTCPKCAKKYGHNYVVAFARTE